MAALATGRTSTKKDNRNRLQVLRKFLSPQREEDSNSGPIQDVPPSTPEQGMNVHPDPRAGPFRLPKLKG